MSPLIDWLVQICTDFIGNAGLPAVFLLMTLESACIPAPSEAIMLFAGFAVSAGTISIPALTLFGQTISSQTMSLLAIVAAGVLGNILGSWIAYAVGLYGGRPFIDRYGKYVLLRHHHLDLAERWFDRWGAPAVFFSRMLPIVRTFISLPAGVARMPFWKFTLYTALGCIPWVFMLGIVGLKVGENWEDIRAQLHYADYLVVAAIVGLIVWWAIKRRRTRGETDVTGEAGGA